MSTSLVDVSDASLQEHLAVAKNMIEEANNNDTRNYFHLIRQAEDYLKEVKSEIKRRELMTDLFTAVRQWGYDKGIIFDGNETRQMLKTIEECGELASALNKGDRAAAEDAYGDIIVTIIVGAACYGLRAEECLNKAYEIISKRKGQTVDGVFVKEGES